MKNNNLRSIIRKAILEELSSPMNDPRIQQIIQMIKDVDVDGETMEYILRQVGMEDQMANQLVNYPAEYAASLKEAKKEEETPDEEDMDVESDINPEDISTDAVDPNVKSVQDALTQAQAAAEKLGDEKLLDQIGNTITFFTRAHIADKNISESKSENIYQDTADRLLGIDDDWTINDIKEHLLWLINNPSEIADGYNKNVFKHQNVDKIMKYVKELKSKSKITESMFPILKKII